MTPQNSAVTSGVGQYTGPSGLISWSVGGSSWTDSLRTCSCGVLKVPYPTWFQIFILYPDPQLIDDPKTL